MKGIYAEGYNLYHIRNHPNILELTPQIVNHRVNKLKSIKQRLECDLITGNKSEWENKFQKNAKRNSGQQLARPMFSPTEMEFIQEKSKHKGQAWIDGEMAPLRHGGNYNLNE